MAESGHPTLDVDDPVDESEIPLLLRPALRGTLHRWAVPVAVALTTLLAIRADGAGARAAVIVYGICVTAMLATSGVYHAARFESSAHKRLLRRLDHCMILVGIAGTYTAVIVLALDGVTRVVLLAVAWALAVVGVTVRMFWLDAPSGLIAAVYLVAGWQIMIDLPAYARALSGGELALLAVGGGLYTVGAGGLRAEAPEPVARRVRLPRGVPHPRGRRGVLALAGHLVPRCLIDVGPVLFKQRFLDGIANGSVTLAFRRQRRPTVRSGGTLTTPVGVLAIDDVQVVTDVDITDDDARRAGYDTREALLAELGPAEDDRRLYRVELRLAGDDPRIARRQQAQFTDDDVTDLFRRLERLDRASRHGPWTAEVLTLIAAHPGVRAGDLAERLGRERLDFKADVRKLKALGLTESLTVGYRLSPRGRAWLDRQDR